MGIIRADLSIIPNLTPDDSSDIDVEALFYAQSNQIINIMPTGTRYAGYRSNGIRGIAVVRSYFFEHPAFDDGSYIQIVFKRMTYKEKEKIKACSLFSGIKYYDKNHNEIGN